MSRLFRFSRSVDHDPDIEVWWTEQPDELRVIAQRWFGVIRASGEDVRETLHDDQPTACVDNVAFAYVDAFTAHVNVGFYHGAQLDDPDGLLQGSGRFMRHVKLRPGDTIDQPALTRLIESAYQDIKQRLSLEPPA